MEGETRPPMPNGTLASSSSGILQPSSSSLLSSPGGSNPTHNAASPLISPMSTPNPPSPAQCADPVPAPEKGAGTRSKELGVDSPIRRSPSPVRRIAEQMPLPASPSESTYAGSRERVLNGSPQSKRQQSTPSIGIIPLSEPDMSPTLGSSPSRSTNAGLGVGLVGSSGLGVPMTKAEKRRSINPAMTFNIDPQNSTFAVEPRNTQLPPSPLRSSFTDLQAQRQTPQSPSSLTPVSPALEGFPFKHPTPGHGKGTTKIDAPSPSRYGSSPDPHAAESWSDVGAASKPLPSSRSGSVDRGEGSLDTPKLQPPVIRPMSFSLSDPDFASILNNIGNDATKTADAGQTGRLGASLSVRPDGDTTRGGSAPVSPTGLAPSISSPALARSPQMDMLSSAAADGDSTTWPSASTSRSQSAGRLSPSSAAGSSSITPQLLLRTRQPSADSTISVSSRSPDTAFSNLVQTVAAAKHAGKDNIPMELSALSAIIEEMEEMKDSITGLKSKYMGVKVRLFMPSRVGLTGSGLVNSTVKA